MSAVRDSYINKHYQRLQRADGVAVVYHRGGIESGEGTVTLNAAGAALVAIRGKADFELADAEGFLSNLQTRDYIMPQADLVIDSARFQPTAGDVIEELRDGEDSRYFKVIEPAPQQPAWKWSDPDRTWLRIHTTFLKEAAAS